MNFIGTSKTRRSLQERKIDILGREKTCPGKITKPTAVKWDAVKANGKMLKVNSGKQYRSKYPGRIVHCVGNQPKTSGLTIHVPGKGNIAHMTPF